MRAEVIAGSRSGRRRPVVAVAALLILMAATGLGVWALLGHFRHLGSGAFTAGARKPTATTATLTLPGTIYVEQGGDLYALRGGHFTAALIHDERGSWTEPAVVATGGLVVVARSATSSDLYRVDVTGAVQARLTQNAVPVRDSSQLYREHWAFYPRASSDGATIFYATDNPKQGFRVDLAIWSRTLAADPARAPVARRWSTPADHTGGDVQPLPVAGGGLIYVHYSFDTEQRIRSQLWLQPDAQHTGHALTQLDQNCAEPDLSADGRTVAMVCTQNETARVVTASFDGTTLGPLHVAVDGTQAAHPTWAPDGSGIVYLAPRDVGGLFQLWWLPRPESAASRPVAVTEGLDLDGASGPAWSAA